ncbi:MAG: gliding motility-associated ABC transporter substrate-binding protein GldG [Flavobacteriaceae bacterium]|nr:gliding motility-associated ABC transporter substrate-binding protein GldG [Flavobacteriaceae bacterium]
MKITIKILVLTLGLILLNFISSKIYKQFDLTKDKRYTLAKITKTIVSKIKKPIIVKVYLEGDFPSEFKRLQLEVKQHLKQLSNNNKNIIVRFINPLGIEKELLNQGLQPSKLSVQEGAKISQAIIFPYAHVLYNDKLETISLLSTKNFNSQEEQLQASIENLEYVFTDAIYKIMNTKKKNIAILTGNGELDFIYIDGLLKTLSRNYHLEAFPLDSANIIPQKTLELLTKFDLAIIAKPIKRFTEKEKFTLDQFQTNNGKTLWLIDNVIAEQDSLAQTGSMLAINRNLNLTDLLFQYGVRIKHNIIKDMYSSTIKLANGNIGGQTQYKDYLWNYYPMITSKNNHAINKNILAVQLRFANTIDLLENKINKTVLLQSSIFSKPFGTPFEINFNEINERPIPKNFNKGNQILGVLLEGEFDAAYKDRIKPYETKLYKEKSAKNKMIVIADGDIIKNQIHQGEPLDLGIDKWTGQRYGNKDFLLNAVNYLLDDNGLLALRSKNIQLQFLDKEKAFKERNYWQFITVVLPLLILGIFGFLFTYFRKKKYA